MGSYTRRQKLWDREALNAWYCTGERIPICNLCGLQIKPGHDWDPEDGWDESHGPRAKAFGGRRTQVGHRSCNQKDGIKVKQMVTKADRVRAKHNRSWRPDHPVPGGRNAKWKRTLSGKVVDRKTGQPWRG